MSIMTDDHKRLTTSFDKNSTASDVIKGIDLSGKRAIVTGASSGLGTETARALASAGADITLAVRNIEASRKAAEEITAKTGNPNVHVAQLDLDDRASIGTFVKAWQGPLHMGRGCPPARRQGRCLLRGLQYSYSTQRGRGTTQPNRRDARRRGSRKRGTALETLRATDRYPTRLSRCKKYSDNETLL